MVRKILVLTCFAVVLTGCFGPSGPKRPDTGKPPTGPDDLFTGEPTSLVVNVLDSNASVAAMKPPSLLALEEPEKHTVVIGTPIHNESGHAYTMKYTIVEVDPNDDVTSHAFNDVPADRNHKVTAVRLSDAGVIGFNRVSGVDAPKGMTTTVDVPLMEPSYDLTMPNEIVGGSSIFQISIVPHNPGGGAAMLYGDVLMGLSPWSKNGIAGMQEATESGERWSLEIAGKSKEYHHLFFADVDEPKKLYYQVRLCVGLDYVGPYSDQPRCVNIPDVEEGEPLPHVWLIPDGEQL